MNTTADSIGELLTHAIDFANVKSYSVDSIYRPIAEEAVAYGNRLNVDVVKCGSHAERLYLPYFSRPEADSQWATDVSTDIDMMFVFDNYNIVSDVQNSVQETQPDMNLYQLVEASHPGYYYMLPPTVVSLADTGTLKMSLIQNTGLSSETLKMQLEKSITQSKKGQINLIFMETPTFNGPSVTFQSRANSGVMVSIDCVFGVKCFSWPKRLDNFFTRVMNREWPGTTLVRDIREQGCHLVAIGSHSSCLRPYEWRLSSTKAEKMLALSLSENQRLAYQIAKSLIKSNEKTKCISSYYVKTTFFWLCEERQISTWTESSNLENIRSLLEKLLQFLTTKTVPNYFIAENNLVDHFEDETFARAIEGLVELRNTLIPRLAQFLQHVAVMPMEFQKPPIEMITSGRSDELLEYLCVNFCFASIVHTILSQIENKTHVNYLYLAEDILRHLTSSSKIDQIDPAVKYETTDHPLGQDQSMFKKEGWSLSRAGLHSACSLLENILQYFQRKDSHMEMIWRICTELANIAACLMHGYCQPDNAGTPVVNDCMYLLDRSAFLHHEYALAYIQAYWKRYPKYRIEPTKNPNKLSFYFLEMWIMILIKYQRESDYQFGMIGRGNKDNMRLPICVRRLVEFMIFYDCDKTWALLQIDSSLFGGKPIANSLRTKRVQHSSALLKLEGVINLTKLKLRAKAYKTDTEKYQLHSDLGKLYHVIGKLENSSEEHAKIHRQSLEYFKDAISSCQSDVSLKVDYAAFLFEVNHFHESLYHIRDSFLSTEGESSLNIYDTNTYLFLPDRLQEIVGNAFPVVIPSLLLACYYVLRIYKSVKISRDQSLFERILECLKEAISSSNDDTRRLGLYIVSDFLSR
ncbi:uncharacterized protein LOC117335160 [Pecten maximus]|uniref:uncharacterized protein LOC117335160 n=1 Tax=Pecten maximus TaxID=6579 RepID=UPI001457F6F2|nr:uncharacterized protein LOC117335160 [Pecten maximus]